MVLVELHRICFDFLLVMCIFIAAANSVVALVFWYPDFIASERLWSRELASLRLELRPKERSKFELSVIH